MSLDAADSQTLSVVRPGALFTASANIDGVDLKDYVGKVALIVNVAVAHAGTSPTYDLYVQSSVNANGTGPVNANVTLTQVANTNSFQVLEIDTRSVRRYLRLVQTIGGSSSPNFPVSIALVGTKQVQ